jgi:hypothetical protein
VLERGNVLSADGWIFVSAVELNRLTTHRVLVDANEIIITL